MKQIAKLKDEARKHEQKEEWEKAIQAYLEVLQIGEQGDGAELELPLYNRVGDLYVRLGRHNDAVTYYEQAADRYADAGLYNNAIALCNKALRYDANRLQVFKKLGSFSASQGFFTDARRWYLEYAEKSAKQGKVEDALTALTEYVTANDDVDVRELLARMLRDNGRQDQAIAQYKHAYALRVAAGQQAEADAIRDQVAAIDPDADITSDGGADATTQSHHEDDALPGFADSAPVAHLPVDDEEEEEAAPASYEADNDDTLVIEQTALDGGLHDEHADFGSIDLDAGFGGGDTTLDEPPAPMDIGLEQPLGLDMPLGETAEEEAHEDAAFDLPTFDEAEDAGEELPTLDSIDLSGDLDGDFEVDEVGTAGEPLPSLDDDFGIGDLNTTQEEDVGEDEHFDLPTFDEEPEPVAELQIDEPLAEPEPLPEPEPVVPEPEPEPVQAAAPPPPPPPPAEKKKEKEYVDLASLLEDDDEAEDSTRFVVEEMAPTGDEEKDFADMLQQFKQKVAETIPKEDAGSHYDLGVAFKEMGLIDEAIAEFQTALRAGQEKLQVYEELGNCFVQKGQFSVAITILNRAASLPFKDESELLGIYYNLGRANEELGNRADAKAAFEKIIAIDIGFMDTTERLSKL